MQPLRRRDCIERPIRVQGVVFVMSLASTMRLDVNRQFFLFVNYIFSAASQKERLHREAAPGPGGGVWDVVGDDDGIGYQYSK